MGDERILQEQRLRVIKPGNRTFDRVLGDAIRLGYHRELGETVMASHDNHQENRPHMGI